MQPTAIAKKYAVGTTAGAVFTVGAVAVTQSQAAPTQPAAPAAKVAPSTKTYVNKQLKTRAPAKLKYRTPTAIGPSSKPAKPAAVSSVAPAAGAAVRSIVTRYSIPNEYGKGLSYDSAHRLYGSECPSDAPIYAGWGVYAANYTNSPQTNNTPIGPVNADGTAIAMYATGGHRANITFFGSEYPKNGPVDLYLTQLCAPIGVPVS